MDPVTLGLASQIDLDLEVQRANKEKPAPVDTGATLLPAAETTARKEAEVAAAAEPEKKPGELDVSAVFAKLKQLGGKGEKDKASKGLKIFAVIAKISSHCFARCSRRAYCA